MAKCLYYAGCATPAAAGLYFCRGHARMFKIPIPKSARAKPKPKKPVQARSNGNVSGPRKQVRKKAMKAALAKERNIIPANVPSRRHGPKPSARPKTIPPAVRQTCPSCVEDLELTAENFRRDWNGKFSKKCLPCIRRALSAGQRARQERMRATEAHSTPEPLEDPIVRESVPGVIDPEPATAESEPLSFEAYEDDEPVGAPETVPWEENDATPVAEVIAVREHSRKYSRPIAEAPAGRPRLLRDLVEKRADQERRQAPLDPKATRKAEGPPNLLKPMRHLKGLSLAIARLREISRKARMNLLGPSGLADLADAAIREQGYDLTD